MDKRTKKIHDDTKNIVGGVRNILVRQFPTQVWPVLTGGTSNRELLTLKSWQSWSLYKMLGTRQLIMTNASLGLESLSFRISCSGPKTLWDRLCIG